MIFVDTNIFIYLIFPVDPQKYRACRFLFERASKGEETLWTTEWVIAELIWFCHRKKKTRSDIKNILHKIISTPGMIIRGKSYILEALQRWDDRVDYIDAWNIILLTEEDSIKGYSYDKGLDTVEDFVRVEP
ncbi:type II toxin-antitoxin system VapC family toxin [Candidatus Gottesmanbacteria bacterium]|nr:type II toxin-antitoxin system VapC family toxin [Candidatus Gottesmanbacteria bacterium]